MNLCETQWLAYVLPYRRFAVNVMPTGLAAAPPTVGLVCTEPAVDTCYGGSQAAPGLLKQRSSPVIVVVVAGI